MPAAGDADGGPNVVSQSPSMRTCISSLLIIPWNGDLTGLEALFQMVHSGMDTTCNGCGCLRADFIVCYAYFLECVVGSQGFC